jgi:NAD(P)-dependent dehydrogenase (short-subunit alcohol dehydrogenase family)
MTVQFEGGVAVITGAGNGIGRALGIVLAGEGMEVVAVGRTAERLDGTVQAIRQVGGTAQATVIDVSQRDQMEGLADQLYAELGRVDVLALNAGVTSAGPLVDHSPEDWDWVYGSNLFGVVYGIQAFAPRMLAAGTGHIVMTGSQMGVSPDAFTYHGPYTSAKTAVTGLAVGLRPEAAEHGVGVSLLIPAGTHTGLVASNSSRPSIVKGDIPLEQAPHPMKDIMLRPGGPEPLPGGGDWLTAEQVARRTLDGIRENELFIVTHPGMKPFVEDYTNRLLQAYDHAADRMASNLKRSG